MLRSQQIKLVKILNITLKDRYLLNIFSNKTQNKFCIMHIFIIAIFQFLIN